jgi:hypothetical protein
MPPAAGFFAAAFFATGFFAAAAFLAAGLPASFLTTGSGIHMASSSSFRLVSAFPRPSKKPYRLVVFCGDVVRVTTKALQEAARRKRARNLVFMVLEDAGACYRCSILRSRSTRRCREESDVRMLRGHRRDRERQLVSLTFVPVTLFSLKPDLKDTKRTKRYEFFPTKGRTFEV